MARKPRDLPEDEIVSSGGLKMVFDSFLHSQRPSFSLGPGLWSPPTDVYETATELCIKIEVPGMRAQDFEISLHENHLRVSGKRCDPDHPCMKCLHQVEVRYGQFERSFELVGKIDADNVHATYEDGFLRISLPKRPARRRRIRVADGKD